MTRLRRRRHELEHDNIHRWLVSYADYMTLMFALFVVLYAMAMVNEKTFDNITESFGKVFQAYEDKPKNKGHGESVLMVNSRQKQKPLYGDGILPESGTTLLDNKSSLSNISDELLGSNLTSLEEKLHTALYDLIESGYSQLQIDGDWLEIELNSGLLFPSGSSSPTNSARTILQAVYEVIDDSNNYIRVRGYTDNQKINNEVFSSNWELSVFRATSILRALEELGVLPERMAIEGYGQYSPSENNSTAQGRAKNRKVVIAISKFGLDKGYLNKDDVIDLKRLTENKAQIENQPINDGIKVIKLESGGIRITTRENESNQQQQENSVNNEVTLGAQE